MPRQSYDFVVSNNTEIFCVSNIFTWRVASATRPVRGVSVGANRRVPTS